MYSKCTIKFSEKSPAPWRSFVIPKLWKVHDRTHSKERMCYIGNRDQSATTCFDGVHHRVGRVLSFSPVVGIGSVPPPLWFRGEGHIRWRERGGRVPIPTRGHTLWYSLYICTLWCTCTDVLLDQKRAKTMGSRVGNTRAGAVEGLFYT